MHATPFTRALAIAAGATFTAVGLVATGGSAHAAAALVVGNPATCTNAQYRTINDAVAAASPGDTIKVCAGSYGEQVVVDKPGLTFLGALAGVDGRKKIAKSKAQTIVANPAGDFVLQGNADQTTIDGFTITGASNLSADGVAAFQGSSGLTLINNQITNNGNGVNLQNPDGSQPASISQNNFVRNSANYISSGPGQGQNGTGVFISNGPADNTQIVENNFSLHTETAINFAGDSTNPSVGLVVADNKSTNDATFVVATNSSNAVIDGNLISTSANGTLDGFGTGILDFGGNSDLRIVDNALKATGVAQSSGINVRNFGPGASTGTGTTVTGNSVDGWLNNLRIDDGSIAAYAAGNSLSNAQADGIKVGSSISGAYLAKNKVTGAATHSCEDQSTGGGTSGTANTWRRNTSSGAPSAPAGIC